MPEQTVISPTRGSSTLWSVLVYRIPTHPSRVRLSIWRKLQSLGAVYLQDAVCVLPARPELDENLQYVAAEIQGQGGSARLMASTLSLPGDDEGLIEEFRRLADTRYSLIRDRLNALESTVDEAITLADLENAEESLKRERIAYLRAKRIAYFGGGLEPTLEVQLDEFRRRLDTLNRGGK